MTSPASVRVENLSHRYTKEWAVKNLNFEIARSGVTGLLGANGAGKSTFMNIMCGVLYPTMGDVLINGVSIREEPLKAKVQIGFLPQQAPLHLELTVDEYLYHCATLRGVEPGQIREAVEGAKLQCGVAEHSRRLIRNLSGGYRQRVGLAQAILHQPSLVVLDEPTSGLDPNQVLAVRKLIRGIAAERTVILSTHILSEVEAICDHIQMIRLGEIVFSGSIEAFGDVVAPHSLIAVFANPPTREALLAVPGVEDVELVTIKKARVHFDGDRDVAERIIALGHAQGWRLREISFERSTLESVFAHLSATETNGSPEAVAV